MEATRVIGLSIVGILALAACSPAVETISDAAVVQTSAPTPSRTADGSPDRKTIYLTFDDGPSRTYTGQILDILQTYDASATFFVNGVWAKQRPELIHRIAADGHAIGNHTWSHADLTSLNNAAVRRELERTTKTVGPAMGPCMRPPYGLILPRVREVSRSLGYEPILWTAHATDWAQPPVKTMIADMKAVTEPNMILLLHDGGGNRPNTVKAVRKMIPKWQADGYTLESLPACRN